MDLVKPWLVGALLSEVKPALEWREGQEHRRGQSQDFERRVLEDSGVLCITPARMGQMARILKIQTPHNPTRIHISDTDTRLSATLSATATQEHHHRFRRDFSMHTLGGILQLIDYEFKITSLGPKQSQITLFVRKFKFVGAGGTTIAHIPRPIEDVNMAKDLLAKLDQRYKARDSSKSKDTSTRQSSPSTSGFPSPANGSTKSTNPLPATEHSAFPSQLPIPNLDHVTAWPAGGVDGRSSPPQSTLTANSVNQRNSLMKASAHGDAHLLRLIARKRSEIGLAGAQDVFAAPKESSDILTEDIQQPQHDHTVTGADTEPRRVQSPIEDVQVDDRNQKQSESQTATSGDLAVAAFQSSQVPSTTPQSIVGAPNLEKESEKISELASASFRAATNRRKRHSKRRPVGKISIRDILIPREQETLLARPDSWSPAAPNQQEPSANIPLSILKMINTRSSRRVGHTNGVSNEQDDVPVVSEEVYQADSDLLSNASADSVELYEWDSSPPQGVETASQLPPDSSPSNLAEIAHHSVLDQSKTSLNGPINAREDAVQESMSSLSFNSSQTSQRSPFPHSTAASPENAVDFDQSTPFVSLAGRILEQPDTIASQGVSFADLPDNIIPVQQSDEVDTTSGSEAHHDEFSVPSSPPAEDNDQASIPDEESRPEPDQAKNQELVPSTAIQHDQVSIQVKRTPHTQGQLHTSHDVADHTNSSNDAPNSVIYGSTFYSSGHPDTSGSSGSATKKDLSSSLIDAILSQDEPRMANRTAVTKLDDENIQPEASVSCDQDTKNDGDLKRKASTFSPRHSASSKRSKVSDFLADSFEQSDEQPIAPGAMADQFRRDFFERRSSGSSLVTSNQTSPAKQRMSDGPLLRSDSHQLSNAREPEHDAKAGAPRRFQALSRSPNQSEFSSQERRFSQSLFLTNDDMVLDDKHALKGVAADRENNNDSLSTLDIKEDIQINGSRSLSSKANLPSYTSSIAHDAEPGVLHDQIDSKKRRARHSSTTRSHSSIVAAVSQSPRSSPGRKGSSQPEISEPVNGNDGSEATFARSRSTPKKFYGDRARKSAENLTATSSDSGAFERFLMAYPEYSGSLKHFRSLCTTIARQLMNRSIFPLALWDDFIIRHRLEYCSYRRACDIDGEEGLSYEDYYQSSYEEPKYTFKILSREDVFANMTPTESISRGTNTPQLSEGKTQLSTRDVLQRAAQSMHRVQGENEHRDATSPNGNVREYIKAPSPEIQISSAARPSVKRNSTAKRSLHSQPVTIDLTNEEPLGFQKSSVQGTPTDLTAGGPARPRRKIPWLHGSNNKERSPRGRGREQAFLGPTSSSAIKERDSNGRDPTRSYLSANASKSSENQESKQIAKFSARNIANTEWNVDSYRDVHTPYNDWYNNYRKIRPANGNSFATQKDVERGKRTQKQWLASARSTRVWGFADEL